MTTHNVLSPLSPDALDKFKKEKKIRSKERGICACGHSMSRHYQSDYDGAWSCTPGKLYCACSSGRVVMVADDLRLFMYATTGVGAEHALGKGMLACIDKKVEFQWIVDGDIGECICQICKEVAVEPIPVSLDLFGEEYRPVNRSAKMDGVVCLGCYTERWGNGSVAE